MWKYNYEPYLEHKFSLFGKKSEPKKIFKYYKKIEKNGKTRYFYSKEEYEAYLDDSKKEESKKSLKDKISEQISKFKKKDITSEKTSKWIETGKAKVNSVLEKKTNGVANKDKSVSGLVATVGVAVVTAVAYVAAAVIIDKVAGMIGEAIHKLSNKISGTKNLPSDYPIDKIPDDYMRKYDSPKSAEDKFDNNYTSAELVKIIRSSGLERDIKADIAYRTGHFNNTNGEYDDDTMFRYLKHAVDKDSNETITHYLEKYGLLNELSEYAPKKTFSDLKRFDPATETDEERLSNVNKYNLWNSLNDTDTDDDGRPDNKQDYGYLNNCAYCTLTYELRSRGYDVEATAASAWTHNTKEVIESWYVGGEFSSEYDGTVTGFVMGKQIAKKEGSRGQFIVFWNGGGGHSMIYEVKDGVTYIKDGQSNRTYTYSEWNNLYGKYVASSSYMRTDNLEINESALVGVKNRKEEK